MQVKNAFYLASANAAKTVRQWAAHVGLTVSPSSIENIRISLIDNQRVHNSALGATKVLNLAYDNCDFKFGVGQSMDLNERSFESITTGLFIDMHSGILPEDIEYAEHVWSHHRNNEESTNPLPKMTFLDILPTDTAQQKLDKHCQWHIHSILVEKYFPLFRSKLGEPPSKFRLVPEKTSYSTAQAMYAKASIIDGNIEALADLLKQSSIVDMKIFTKYMVFVHGDLGTMEKIDTIL